MRIDVVTTFPELFAAASPAVLGVSIPARAIAAGALEVVATDIRSFTYDKHHKTDDRPFGGGPGMVMLCQPLYDAVKAVEALGSQEVAVRRVLLTPQGVSLTQKLVEELARAPRLVLIAGHYEGIDERVIEELAPLEVSIGDYVLSGGELAALVLIDAIARLQQGVLGDALSSVQDSFSQVVVHAPKPLSNRVRKAAEHAARFGPLEQVGNDTYEPHNPESLYNANTPIASTPETRGSASSDRAAGVPCGTLRLLDCPHYTKPREWMRRVVPEVLLGGNHAKIEAWRLEQRLARTRARRPDLLH